MKPHLLLVEDDELIGSLVTANLEAEGHQVRHCTTIGSARGALEANSFDLLILDYMLPDGDGQELLRWLRNRGISRPVLMLTARGETHLKVSAFNAGADDYLTKPFDMDELLARAGALIRRAQAAAEVPSSQRLRMGACQIDLARQALRHDDGREIALGEKEAAMLELFAREPGRVLSRADIIEEVWGMDAFPSERTVDNFILRLRRMIEPVPNQPRHLISVRGRGYRYEP